MRWALTHLDDIGQATWEHAVLVVVSVSVAFLISFAVGIWASRQPRVYPPIMGITALLYTIPSLALFALLIPLVGLGRVPAIIGLVAYSLLILIRNIATGLREVPADVVEAALGMGMSSWQLLVTIELPLAMPIIIAGLRIATVTVVGIATIAAYINAGGLGTLIFTGIAQDFPAKIVVGAGLASAMAVGADAGLSRLERRLRASREA
ncbi:MAG: ABC transporter permease [candidate division NC10 bacterium RIFCSPLOWO2_12_FULL_66_18]|nr:MAG: ABC transporter permease [candidate division NC10 bacterium RIFCSPLOWO2_02_FULL_66_22]OGB96404.1 MAG: ABC transporter permease [candidate division NC10 bacterium RIFCSPLOWO2_12_FULL_66_18]